MWPWMNRMLQWRPPRWAARLRWPDRRGWTRLAWAAAGLGVALGLAWAFSPRPVEVETAAAQRRAFEQTIEDDGRARARERIVMSMPWAGALERVSWKESQAVMAGQPLFWVRPVQPGLQDARTRAEWEARGAAAQAGWQRAARQTEVAHLAWQRAGLAAARAVQLAEEQFISAAQLESALLDLRREERSFYAAQAGERAALREMELARVVLRSNSAARDSQRFPVTFAADVRVLRVLQPNAAVLGAGAAVLEVADVRNPEVVVPLISQDALRVPVGALARLSPWGVGEAGASGARPSVIGRVRVVEPAASTKVSALGLEEQRIAVVIDPQSALPEGDGYAVRVQLVLQREESVLQVPVSAVFPRPGDPQRHAVFTLSQGRAVATPVTLRGRSGGWAWIDGGLQEGQDVVVYPAATLRDKTRVRVVDRR